MMGDLEPLILTVCGAILGAVFMVFMTPDPAPRQDCRIHVVDRKVATAYVLKPPTVPAPEPVVIKEKCEPAPAPVSAPQTVVVEAPCKTEKPEKAEKAEKKDETKALAKPKQARAHAKPAPRHKVKGRTRRSVDQRL